MMFGDNESVVNGSTIPHSKLNKRHTNALAYHKTRELIASKTLRYVHMDGDKNPADILSKHWAHSKIWNTLRPFMFWNGDTDKLAAEPEETPENEGKKGNDPSGP